MNKSDGRGRNPNSAKTRFRTGQSGNPSGRPKGAKNRNQLIAQEADALIIVNENGQRKKISKWQAAVKQLMNKAAAGDLSAFKVAAEFLRQLNEPDSSVPPLRTPPENMQEAVRIYVDEIRNG